MEAVKWIRRCIYLYTYKTLKHCENIVVYHCDLCSFVLVIGKLLCWNSCRVENKENKLYREKPCITMDGVQLLHVYSIWHTRVSCKITPKTLQYKHRKLLCGYWKLCYYSESETRQSSYLGLDQAK